MAEKESGTVIYVSNVPDEYSDDKDHLEDFLAGFLDKELSVLCCKDGVAEVQLKNVAGKQQIFPFVLLLILL